MLITGSTATTKGGILVSFDNDPHGLISVHTCARKISLPCGVFKDSDYPLFEVAINCVLTGQNKLSFNGCK